MILLQCGFACAQNSAGSFDLRQYSEGLGLSSSYVVGTIECPDGRLMVATKAGVELFDGRVFSALLNGSEPIDNVSTLSSNGNVIYMGLTDGGILKFSRGEVSKLKTGIEDQIKFLHADAKLGMVGVTRLGQLFVLKDDKTSTQALLGDESLVNVVVMPSEGLLFLGTNDGLFIAEIDANGKPISVKPCSDVPRSRIMNLWHDSDTDEVWVGTEESGLFRIRKVGTTACNAQSITLNGTSLGEVNSVYPDSKGHLWLGLSNKGLQCVDFPDADGVVRPIQLLSEQSLQQHVIHGIVEDEEGTIWVSTFGGGLIQVLDRVFDHPFHVDWLRQHRITRLYRDSQERTWIGINKGIFLTKAEGAATEFTYHHLGGQTVTSIDESQDGALWVGTESNGLYKSPKGSSIFTNIELPNGLLSNAINAIVIDKEKVHVCTKGGLYILDLSGRVKKSLTSEDGLPHNNVLFAHTDKSGNTWIANQGNRISFYRNGKVNFLEDRNAQSITDVHHILESVDGRLWFATLGSGVFVLDNGTAHHIGEAEGLPSSYCYQLEMDDDGNVWVSHQKSISKISPQLKVEMVIGHQHLSPVANTMITSMFKDGEGRLWVTSTHGVVRYDPSIDKSRRSIPRLSIIGMRVNDEAVSMVEDLSLPYKQHSVVFDVSGISLRDPESIRYKYRLLGFSDAWSDEFTSHAIQFPRLEDGEYTLEVVASKNEGTWSTSPASYSFVIRKPIWRTWPFFILLFIAIVAGVGGYVRYRTVKLISDKVALESLVSERTEEIQHQKEEIEKSRDEIARYAKDITDSIKYAQRIQSAIFPEWESLKAMLPDSFVFFRSKDIVSGDFFFAEKVGDLRIIAAVDCTGHGVPGGFMSIVANNLLTQAVKQMGLTKPSEILDYLNEGITNTLHQTYEESSVKDGLDIAVCTLNIKTRKLEFSGAYNPLYLFRNEELIIYRGDRFPVGMFVGEEAKIFSNIEVQLEPGDVFYIFSDGFADQFGGPRGKKLKLHGFRDLLLEIHKMPAEQQRTMLALKLDEWMGNLDQVDDIVILGVRIS